MLVNAHEQDVALIRINLSKATTVANTPCRQCGKLKLDCTCKDARGAVVSSNVRGALSTLNKLLEDSLYKHES